MTTIEKLYYDTFTRMKNSLILKADLRFFRIFFFIGNRGFL